MPPRTADELRTAFTDFFVRRGHTLVPSASLIPHDPSLMFTVAGMVPFKPYFVGDESPPFARAVSIQKCVRAGGKHNDLDDIGRTNRHFSFFEMLGNFSFGDYFKADAIPWAWEFVTSHLALDPERLWVTVHVTDDDAASIWRDAVGVPDERVQRLEEDNFWRMAETGPCGPCSEIFWDLGERFGEGGGPAVGHADRYIEIWNLVFMQYEQQAGGMVALPRPSIDTGAGLERLLMALQGVESIFDIDVFRPLIAAAEATTGTSYTRGAEGVSEQQVALRILAEHARTMTFLIADGVVPSNEERGYVLRRIIRRAVRHAFALGATDLVTPALVDATVEVMGDAYPEIVKAHDVVARTVAREEERFRQTLERGLELLDDLLAAGDVSGEDAFFLHDSLGFPIDLTREIAAERGRQVDTAGFEVRMAEQRARARAAHEAAGGRRESPVELYREVLEEHGPTEFTGRKEYVTTGASVLALVVGSERVSRVAARDLSGEAGGARIDVVLDRTPFYAESGGQVGDTGVIESAQGARLRVLDTQYGLTDLVVHVCELEEGVISEGEQVTARIDGERRDRIRRNHTATHILHWALREVLGPHVKQAGSLVAPDRLRFDFSHYEAVTPEQLARVEDLANAEVITDAPVRHYETTKEHAESIGAVAFFGEKYGDLVRVLEAGEHSIELCGGTHVHALGFIGPIKIVSESSIGANLRRIEAVTGDGALAYIRAEERALREAASVLQVGITEVPERVHKLLAELRAARQELAAHEAKDAAVDAARLVAEAVGGAVVARRDLPNKQLEQLARAVRDALGSGVVALVGRVPPERAKAAIAVAVTRDLVDRGISAGDIAAPAAKLLGGGTAKNADIVAGGGPHGARVDEALAVLEGQVRAALDGIAASS